MISYTLVMILATIVLLGVTTGLLGTFVFLKGESLIGDAISHASLPGIMLAFLILQTKNPYFLLVGGSISGSIGIILMKTITSYTRLKNDAALGIVLSLFFGLGLVLMTIIQKMPLANQSILNKFLFGNITIVLRDDLYAMMILSIIVLVGILLFWKEITLSIFDPVHAHSVGFSLRRIDIMFTMLLVGTIVLGIQSVGIILMSSMLIAPAAAARQWTNRLYVMALLSICFATSASIAGVLLSVFVSSLPTGPAIVIVLSCIVFVSLMLTSKTVRFKKCKKAYKEKYDGNTS